MVSSDRLQTVGIIPARFASQRLPGKPLEMIGSMSLLERVYRQSLKCDRLSKVVIATDDERILKHARTFGAEAFLTSTHHPSGTDRLGETVQLLQQDGWNFDIAVNIQGDEPFIDPRQIDQLIGLFQDNETQIATLIRETDDMEAMQNPNVVKVVTDKDGFALYFSRAPIPYPRNNNEQDFFTHVGIYGYRVAVLKRLVSLPPAPPELAESLEQLRWLWNGFRIKTAITDLPNFGIDTPEDLQEARKILKHNE